MRAPDHSLELPDTAAVSPAPAAPAPTAMVSPSAWTETLSFDPLFPVRQPLEVDLGCGKGRFLLARASGHPERNFLGVDRLLVRLRKIDKRIARNKLTNVRLLRIENAYATRHLLPPASVSVFYVFFPDPWPKRRHHRRRLFAPEFLADIHRALVPGGIIHVATDHADYALHIAKCFAGSAAFRPAAVFVPAEAEQTDFERLFLGQGLTIHRCAFEAVVAPAPSTTAAR